MFTVAPYNVFLEHNSIVFLLNPCQRMDKLLDFKKSDTLNQIKAHSKDIRLILNVILSQ